MPDDIIRGEILPDGSVRILTEAISPANHDSAEEFLAKTMRRTGGDSGATTERADAPIGQAHHHGEHEHEH